MFKFGNVVDQKLRPWTLDVDFDESISLECGELDKAMRRTSPFKKGGDYAYLDSRNTPPSKIRPNGLSTASSATGKARKLSPPINILVEDAEITNLAAITDRSSTPNLKVNINEEDNIIRKYKSIKPKLPKSNVYQTQSEKQRRKPLMRNLAYQQQQQYHCFLREQVRNNSNQLGIALYDYRLNYSSIFSLPSR